MKIIQFVLVILLVGSVRAFCADSPAAPAAPSDPLSEALPVLEKSYPDFAALNYKPGDKLHDLIVRSKGGITLEPAVPTSPSLIESATLPGNVIYWRLASFKPAKNWADLTAQLGQVGSSATGVILDLRSNSAPDDYPGAAQALAVFAPGDSVLAKYQAAGAAPVVAHPILLPIVVVANDRTAGSAEALAVRLQADGALVVGRATEGKIGIFAEQKLSSGQFLRYFTGPIEASDPARSSQLAWNQPVTPDISLSIDDHSEKRALMLIRDNHVLDVVEESPERHRMSEASLVQGQDPEWDDYLTSLEDKPVLLSLPLVHDTALITALDSLKAIQLSQRTVPTPAGADTSASASTSVQ